MLWCGLSGVSVCVCVTYLCWPADWLQLAVRQQQRHQHHYHHHPIILINAPSSSGRRFVWAGWPGTDLCDGWKCMRLDCVFALGKTLGKDH